MSTDQAPSIDRTIRVNIRGRINGHFNVHATDQIVDLVGGDSRVVFDGTVINKFLSFAFYRIKDEDTLYVLGPPNGYRGAGVFPNNDELIRVNNVIRKLKIGDKGEISNTLVLIESARLLDLSFNRLASKSSSFRRICKIVKCKTEKQEESAAAPNTVLPEKPEAPSTEFLPLSQSQPEAN